MTHQEKLTHRYQIIVVIVIALGLVALFAGLWRSERQKKNIIFSSVDTTFLQDPDYDGEVFFLRNRIDSLAEANKRLKQLRKSRDVGNTLVIEESTQPPTDILRERLLVYCKELDDTLVNIQGDKLVNFRIAQNYTSRGILRISEVQLAHCMYAVDDYKELDTLRVKRILELEKGARHLIRSADTCNTLLIKKGQELAKVNNARNYWRIGALISGMVAALFIVK